jgi:hypothetical protein
MSLEMLNTVASLLTVAVVSATAIAAIVQLRHLRVSNQINAMLEIGKKFEAPAYLEASALVARTLDATLNDPSFRQYEVARGRDLPLPDIDPKQLEVRRAAISVGNTFDEMGLLLKNGCIDRDLFVYQYEQLIRQEWNRLELFIAFARQARGSNTMWEMFEYLVVVTVDLTNDKPGTYPPALRRLELHNPWPSSAPTGGA